MSFFMDIGNTKPFLKLAAEGIAGSGKTYTTALIAIGLHKRIKSTKPIVIFDTEESSRFLRPLFEKDNIQVLVKQSRTLSDWSLTVDHCVSGTADILITDSITHIYDGFLQAYMERTGRKRLEFQDWGVIKPLWRREFSEKFVRAHLHILFTGREGFTYDYEVNDNTGKKELRKTGVKMRAEAETAHEPDVLMQMSQYQEMLGDDKKVWREAFIMKDRSTLIDGKTFRNPAYKEFEPMVEWLLSDPKEEVKTDTKSDADMFGNEEDRSKIIRERTIFLERNDAELDKVCAGTSADAKSLRLALTEKAYGETSDTKIQGMALEQVQAANGYLTRIVPIIDSVLKGEKLIYPKATAVEAARFQYIDTDNLGLATIDALVIYQEHLRQEYANRKEK